MSDPKKKSVLVSECDRLPELLNGAEQLLVLEDIDLVLTVEKIPSSSREHLYHIKPLSEICEEYIVNPISDLLPVCPNYQAIIHLKKPPYSPHELSAIFQCHKETRINNRL